jgi:hypothetical protein
MRQLVAFLAALVLLLAVGWAIRPLGDGDILSHIVVGKHLFGTSILTESETDYDTETEYDPTDSDSCYTESGETESCVSADTEEDTEEEYPVADNLKTKIENLRSELAEAERMLKWWEEEQRTQQMENAACLPNILLSALLSVTFVMIVGLMNAPNIHRRF